MNRAHHPNIRLPENIAHFFTKYLQRLQAVLPDRVYGCYLYGSLTLGAYDPAKSDLDFMTVLIHALDDDETTLLQQFHARLNRVFPLARRMEGHYVPLSELQCSERSNRYPGFFNGQYHGMQGVMTLYWYQKLHTCGIRVTGPDPATLFPPVAWESLQQEMDYNINRYWFGRVQQPVRTFLSDASVEFAVLTLCRIHYTLQHRQIIAKTEAGQWALHLLSPDWLPLIQESLRIRTKSAVQSLFASRWQRAHAVRTFILAMREQCNVQYFDYASDHRER